MFTLSKYATVDYVLWSSLSFFYIAVLLLIGGGRGGKRGPQFAAVVFHLPRARSLSAYLSNYIWPIIVYLISHYYIFLYSFSLGRF
jgi:hypothetical protein